SNFDIFATAGGADIAVIKQFSATASTTGTITIQFTTVTDNAQVNGIEVLGASSPTPTPTVAPTATPTSGPPNFGPNVYVFDPSMSASSIQSTLDSVYNQQQTNQFGTNRYALLFKPGTYNVGINLGFYEQVLGLGLLPDNVVINGYVNVNA